MNSTGADHTSHRRCLGSSRECDVDQPECRNEHQQHTNGHACASREERAHQPRDLSPSRVVRIDDDSLVHEVHGKDPKSTDPEHDDEPTCLARSPDGHPRKGSRTPTELVTGHRPAHVHSSAPWT